MIIAGLLLLVFLFRNDIVNWMAGLYYEEAARYEDAEFGSGRLLMMLAILALGLWLRPLKSFDKIYLKAFNIMVLAAAIQVFSIYDNVFTRLANYLYQFVVIYIPMILQPGEEQKLLFPEHRGEIRSLSKELHYLGNAFVTAFAIWFYFRTVSPSVIAASQGYLSQFHFFWEVDSPSSLDLLEEYIQSSPLIG